MISFTVWIPLGDHLIYRMGNIITVPVNAIIFHTLTITVAMNFMFRHPDLMIVIVSIQWLCGALIIEFFIIRWQIRMRNTKKKRKCSKINLWFWKTIEKGQNNIYFSALNFEPKSDFNPFFFNSRKYRKSVEMNPFDTPQPELKKNCWKLKKRHQANGCYHKLSIVKLKRLNIKHL